MMNEKKKTVLDRLKAINVKNIIKSFTLIWGLILIVILTITNVGINEDFNLIQWLSDSMILLGIMVFGLFMGESIGGDKQKEKIQRNEKGEIIGGMYQKSIADYNKYYASIEKDLIYFNQFYQWYMPMQLHDKKLNYLIAKGIDITKANRIVDYCTIDDFFDLKSHPIEKVGENGKHIVIRKLNEYEIEPVEDVLKGKIKLNASSPNYYLTALSEANVGYIFEEGNEIKLLRDKIKRRNRIIKIVSSLSISLALGILTVYDFMGNGDDKSQMKARVNLVSRVSSLLTSLLSGWMQAVIDVKLQCQAIDNKVKVLTLFKDALTKNMFKVMTEDELGEEELKEYNRQKEEAKQNVVEPSTISFEPKEIDYGRK